MLSFLLYSMFIYAWRDGGALQTPTPLLRAQREILTHTRRRSRDSSRPGNTAAITEQFLSRPCPLHVPEGQTRPGWGLWESSRPTAGRREAPAGSAKPRFSRLSPQTSAEHVQGERFEMFIKWPSLAAKQSEKSLCCQISTARWC